MRLSYNSKSYIKPIDIPGSKSITNRLLVLKHLYFPNLEIVNSSKSTDSVSLSHQITAIEANQPTYFVADGGTTFRFLLCLLAIKNKVGIVRAGKTLFNRPHDHLTDSLNNIGFNISSQDDGYAISPIDLNTIKLEWQVDVSISSQFASALVMIAPSLKKHIVINLIGKPVSLGYLDLTIGIMQDLGMNIVKTGKQITVSPVSPSEDSIITAVESDWSAISYFIFMSALSGQTLQLTNVNLASEQPDRESLGFASLIGIMHVTDGDVLTLKPIKGFNLPKTIQRDYTNCPDIALTEMVACFALNIELHATGIGHLQYKESDRAKLIQAELNKFSASVPKFESHGDHRIAMSLCALAILKPIEFDDIGVVSKSFPDFWQEVSKLGINLIN